VSGPPGTRVSLTSVAVESKTGGGHISGNSTSRPHIEWLLPSCYPPKPVTKLLSPQTSNEDLSEDLQISIKPRLFSTSSTRTIGAMAFHQFETSDMSVRDSDFQVTPPDEMSHLWKDDSEQGFWPEIVEGHHTGGCICW
jgi:hypothetical protein